MGELSTRTNILKSKQRMKEKLGDKNQTNKEILGWLSTSREKAKTSAVKIGFL